MSSQSRHIYTRNERMILEASFAQQSHPPINEKERLATLLNCNIIQISNWFQNHRRRVKKQMKYTKGNVSTNTNSSTHQTTYVYQQPNCICDINDNNSTPYYSPTYQYVYSYEPFYTQSTFFDPSFSYIQ
ncbi:unnamed protein product [Adineta steineri]|uniref:Homeobox domain-containing protein n=1 Tax=Adineta steineri TaxID=433720 RepID=A0A814KM56_9BILA|nr:unnamed protein product [Adineta steineri]